MNSDGSIFRYSERTVIDDAWPIFVSSLEISLRLVSRPDGAAENRNTPVSLHQRRITSHDRQWSIYLAAVCGADFHAAYIWPRIWDVE